MKALHSVVQLAERLAARVLGYVLRTSDDKARARARFKSVTGGDHRSSAKQRRDQMVRNTEDLNDLIQRTRDPVSRERLPLVRLRQSQHREPQRDARGDRARGC
jgi:hypothetical protein